MFPSDLTAYAHVDSLKQYNQQKRLHDEIKHIKCPIIKLVRHQMESAEHSICDCFIACRRNKSLRNKLWNNRWTILKWFITLLVMVNLFIYGALIGAGLCSCSVSQHSLPCAGTFSLLPGLNFAKRHHFIY